MHKDFFNAYYNVKSNGTVFMNIFNCAEKIDNGAKPYMTNVEMMTLQNPNFRTAIWTGKYMQMTVMCIPSCGEIGLEIHPETDQLIRVEQGRAVVKMGKSKGCLDFQRNMCGGDTAFIPAGTWHNVVNIGRNPLKVSVIYAPPHHARGTVHRTKADVEKEKY